MWSRRLGMLALGVALLVVPLGAFVRLSAAGLGCPDWPGCFGTLSPHHAAEQIQLHLQQYPDGPVSFAKAWKEMIHRYLASGLGLLVLGLGVLAWRQRQRRGLACALIGVIVLQGMLGMLTVTRLLEPWVVTAHLAGGISMLVLLSLWVWPPRPALQVWPELFWPSLLLCGLVIMQVLLGGWVSSHGAGLACGVGLDGCNGSWSLPDPAAAFAAPPSLSAIHWLHRCGALLVCLQLLWLYWRSSGVAVMRRALTGIALLVALQVLLGVLTVLGQLPLWLALSHHLVAVVLLLACVRLVLGLQRQTLPVWQRSES